MIASTPPAPSTSSGRSTTRIAYLMASVSRQAGGVLNVVRGLGQAIRGPDLSVEVLGMRDSATDADLSTWQPLEPRVFSVRGPDSFRYAPDLNRSLDTLDVDLLHVHDTWLYPSAAAERWARRTRRPHVISPHGMLDPWAVRNARWKKRIVGWLFADANLRRAGCLHALCESEAESIRAYGLKAPTAVIANGIEPPVENSLRPPRPEWREALGDRKVLLFLGRLHPKKGLPLLLDGWSRRKARGGAGDWTLAIAGWNQLGHEEQLREQCQALGLEKDVVFLGPQFNAAKEACLAHADGFVLPSYSEGFPIAVLEAWVHRLPALLTPFCNVPEGYAAGAALRIETEPDSVARGLDELFSMSEAQRRDVGDRGRRLVEERYTWPQIARQMREVYTWLLGGGPRPETVRLT